MAACQAISHAAMSLMATSSPLWPPQAPDGHMARAITTLCTCEPASVPQFLHDHHLTHTDLKPENILFVSTDWSTEYCSTTKRTLRRSISASSRNPLNQPLTPPPPG